MSDLFKGLLFTPSVPMEEVKSARAKAAGDLPAQQRLVQDDRYWHGRDAMQNMPIGAAAGLVASIPYDLMKLGYFHGPKPLSQGLARLSDRMFPDEGFNQETTSRPSVKALGAYAQGMIDGTHDNAQSIGQQLAQWKAGAGR